MIQEALTDPLYLFLLTFYGAVAPYTKVEESFNLHAIHDFIYKNVLDVSQFDHVEFPGVVPRSFIPGLFIALITKSIQFMAKLKSKFEVLLLMRGVIGVINWIGFVYLRESLKYNLKSSEIEKTKIVNIKENLKKIKKEIKSSDEINDSHWTFTFWLFAISASQFHLMFYSTRTLPNFLALPLTNLAFGKLFRGQFQSAIVILSFASIVCRIELAALTLSLALISLLYNKVTVPQLIKSGMIGGFIGIVLSGGIDSFYWNRFTVPELESFIFNVINGKASEWGVSPWFEYFKVSGLRIFFPPYAPLLAFFASSNDPTSNNVLKISMLTSLLFVTIMSFQGHKEWRFIVYVIPLINISAATQCSALTSRAFRTRWNWYKPFIMFIFGCASLSFLVSTFMAEASYFNYPGGQALMNTQQRIFSDLQKGDFTPLRGSEIIIHTDRFVNSNGASLFADLTARFPQVSIKIDKTEDENLLASSSLWDKFDFIVTELSDPSSLPITPGFAWEIFTYSRAYRGIKRDGIKGEGWVKAFIIMWRRKSIYPLYIEGMNCLKLENAVFVYKKIRVD